MAMGRLMEVFGLLALVMHTVRTTYSFDFGRKKTDELMRRLARKMESDELASTQTSSNNGRVFYPSEYGADPTGHKESSDGIIRALNAAIRNASTGLKLLPEITDLGGVVIDLQGGNYMISKPIRFPPKIGNVVFQSGTLRATNNFPNNRYLIELQSDQKPPGKQMSYEDITFRDILFDSINRGSGLILDTCARTRVTNCFFLRFSIRGIFIQAGHETFITNCFLGGYPGTKDLKGTGMDIHSNDNAVTDVAFFSVAVGIAVNGAANMFMGVHCHNKASGGTGIVVNLPGFSQTRIDNCYMDNANIVLLDPVQVVITNGFFASDANIVLRAKNGVVSGLTITNNMFSGTNKPSVELQGSFNRIEQITIQANNAKGGMSLRSSVARLSVKGNNGTKLVADFSKILVFPNRITLFQFSFSAGHSIGCGGGFALLAVTGISNNMVEVQSDRAVQGEVFLEVRQ